MRSGPNQTKFELIRQVRRQPKYFIILEIRAGYLLPGDYAGRNYSKPNKTSYSKPNKAQESARKQRLII